MTESIKGPDKSREGKGSVLPKAAAAGASMFVPVIVVLVVGALLFLPLSPTISGSLTIQTSHVGFESRVQVGITTASYSRETLLRSYSAGTGRIELPIRPSQTGAYTLTIMVSYGNSAPLNTTFTQIGDGTYGFKIRYILQSESANTPYLITILVSGENIQTVSISYMVYPS